MVIIQKNIWIKKMGLCFRYIFIINLENSNILMSIYFYLYLIILLLVIFLPHYHKHCLFCICFHLHIIIFVVFFISRSDEKFHGFKSALYWWWLNSATFDIFRWLQSPFDYFNLYFKQVSNSWNSWKFW